MRRAGVALVLAVFGCGSDDGGVGDTTSGTDPSAATTVTTLGSTSVGSTTMPSTTASLTGTTADSTDGSDSTAGEDSSSETGDEIVCPPGVTVDPCPTFPTTTWESASPEQLGLDATALDAFASAAGNRGFIARYGYQAHIWGDPGGEFEWASASKPVWSTFLLFAVQEGKLDSVDDLIASHGWALNATDQGMTFAHLANQMSGYALPEAPGEAWGYNDYAILLYATTLFERVFDDGGANATAADPARFGPLTFEDGDLFGNVSGAPRVVASPRDFARVGWFWANRGNWDGAQLLPSADFNAYMRPLVPADTPRTAGGTDDYLGIGSAGGGTDQTPLGAGVYGFNWWFNPNGVTWPSAPDDTLQANGHWNGEVLTVIPSLGIVAAWRGSGDPPDAFTDPMDSLLALLVASVTD